MPSTTRSSSRAASAALPLTPRTPSLKRKLPSYNSEAVSPPRTPTKKSRSAAALPRLPPTPSSPLFSSRILPITPSEPIPEVDGIDEEDIIPATLSFSFEDAKRHLIAADERFEDLFSRMKCKPFEELEAIDPFKTLVTSILGQQISWLAAHAIRHKFLRLFDPSLPEKAPPPHERGNKDKSFPTPEQVVNMPMEKLRTAGLSGRKAEYIIDLANYFKDGRLSAKKLTEWTDEDMEKALIDVKGIGKWTVHMFAIFSLRRPDILPVGDLGIQKGLLRWIVSSHSGNKPYTIDPKKLKPSTSTTAEEEDISALLPASSQINLLPEEPLNGSQSQADDTLTAVQEFKPVKLPEGLTLPMCKSRLGGKSLPKKGMYMAAQEIEDITHSWKPYRSLGSYYLWALAEKKE